MNRRSFFATLFGGLLAKFLPKPQFQFSDTLFCKLPSTRVDTLDMSHWGYDLLPPAEPLLIKDVRWVACDYGFRNGLVYFPESHAVDALHYSNPPSLRP